MAGKSEIEAGRAFVSLLLKDKGFSKGLAAAASKMRSFGQGVSVFGAAVTAAGASVVTPLLAMVRGFEQSGSAIHDLAQRTNLSVTAVQELAYAAEQTGTSIEVVEKAISKARKEGKSFDTLAAQVAKIQDPAKQTEKAIELFGVKMGAAIVPMIRELPQLKAKFHELGLGISGPEADAADSLGDSFLDLRMVIKSASDAIGATLAPTVQKAVEMITHIAMTVRDWVRANRELFVTALKIGVAVMGIGAAIGALGGGMVVAGVAFAAFNTFLGAAVTLIGAIVSPIGLVVATLAGLAYWFGTSTEAGRAMVQSLVGWFGELKDIAVEAFGGFADALAAGDLALAAKVAWAGMKLIWLQGTQSLRETWIGFKNVFMQTTLDIVIGAAEIWEKFTARVESLFIGMRQRIMDSVFDIGAFLSKIGKSDSEKAAIDKIRDMGKLANSVIAGAQQTEAEAATKQTLDALAATKKAASGAIDANTQKQLADAESQLKKAQEQLASLRGQAAVERKDKELGKAPGFKPGEFALDTQKVKSQIFGTFSAAAAMAGGAGGEDTQKKILEEERKARIQAAAQHRETKALLRGFGALMP